MSDGQGVWKKEKGIYRFFAKTLGRSAEITLLDLGKDLGIHVITVRGDGLEREMVEFMFSHALTRAEAFLLSGKLKNDHPIGFAKAVHANICARTSQEMSPQLA